ncbi:DNA invertase Pin-like site-specific DNA recombinase [Blastococcus colisei]|uniref:DNA invertase Pin-like site-specific DNA recombinase n=1 Tax=Blastococcus colisei TaxID=1564162 RepID=A0A543NZU5_9ACTN|nr:recombinase family protein [Blastococcus colisei]TQN37366.1 DNA invertase Pin-like site-specific DNA recombinase [Blastococcus colisei]
MGTRNAQVRAVIYARQSKDNADGIDRQIEDCRRLLVREGINPDAARVIVDNDTSASSKKPRPGYNGELLPELEAGGRSVLVVAQTQDRLLRQLGEMVELVDLVERTGARVMLVRAMFDLTTAMGRAAAWQAAVWSRLEVEQKAERQRRQAVQAAERGECPSRRAFGYRPGGKIDPEESAVVRDAFDRLFRGESLVRITEAMNAAGLPSVRGNRWSRKGVAYLLRSPRYAGWRVYHAGADDELRVRGEWPRIVSDAEHEKAVALLTDPVRKVNTLGTARRWLGSGLFVCGRCDAAGEVDEHGQPVTMRTGRRTQGNVRTYICRQHGHLSRAAEPVDRYVADVIEERLAQPDVASLLAGATPEVSELRQEADVIRGKIDRAVRDYDDEVIDGATLKAVKARRTAELAVVERKITAAARSSRLATMAAAPDPAAAFRAADLAVQREVVDALCAVVLLPSPRGASSFDPSTVDIRRR